MPPLRAFAMYSAFEQFALDVFKPQPRHGIGEALAVDALVAEQSDGALDDAQHFLF